MEILTLNSNEINQNGYHINKLTRNKIGFIYTAPIKIVPDDCLACDGYTLKIVDYKKLYAVIGKTFNTGSEADDEFRIPDYNISKRFLQPGSNAGALVVAGLPNISGSLYLDGLNSSACNGLIWGCSGAFYLDSATSKVATYNPTGTDRYIKHVSFNATRSSSRYGKSTTVQPPSQTVHLCIKYK